MTINLIQTITVTAATSDRMTFSAIPQTFDHLYMTISARTTVATTVGPMVFRFNGLVTNLFYHGKLQGNGTTASVGYAGPANSWAGHDGVPGSTSTANTFTNVGAMFYNYAGSATKLAMLDFVGEGNIAATYQMNSATWWNSTAAITQIEVIGSANWAIGTTASLYSLSSTGATGATVA